MSPLSQSLALARIVLRFGAIQRATHDEQGQPESDTTHTIMLALLAASLAPLEAVPLDMERVLRFALVHDLVETYAGDTNTTRALSFAERKEKKRRELIAYGRLCDELGFYADDGQFRWIPQWIELYEKQGAPEARFVRYLDKLLPKLTHLLNSGSALRVQGITRAEMGERHVSQAAEMSTMYPEFTYLHELYAAGIAACAAPGALRLEGE